MKIFRCDHCQQLVFFENVQCVTCGHELAFLPDLGVIASLDDSTQETRTSPLPRSRGKQYRLCENYTKQNVCNWAVAANDPERLCRSCRLNDIIPNLGKEGNQSAWYKFEVAKRRLIYTFLALGLPVMSKKKDADRGLEFSFKENPDDPKAPPVLTGHANGVITFNIAEADDSERERVRNQFQEPYRTILGHFRHESGHYYWDRLIRDGGRLVEFRKLFGGEQLNYGEALKRHHAEGARADWQDSFVSAYATVHPWEDWAETWAHYLHMTDTLETASACGVRLRPARKGDPTLHSIPNPVDGEPESFDEWMESWVPLTYVLNNLNRGLGLPDAYPFVLSPPVVLKLQFIHETVISARDQPFAPAPFPPVPEASVPGHGGVASPKVLIPATAQVKT